MNRRTVIQNLMSFVGLAGASAVASTKNDKFWVEHDVPSEPKRVWKCGEDYVVDLGQFQSWAILEVEGQYRKLFAIALDGKWISWDDGYCQYRKHSTGLVGEVFSWYLLYNSWDLNVKLVDAKNCSVRISHIEVDRRNVLAMMKYVPQSDIVIIPDDKEWSNSDTIYTQYAKMKIGEWSGRK